MKLIFSAAVLLLLCGCFKGIDKLNTLEEYSQTFDSRVKISLSNKKSITLSEARAMALANNPTLHAAASAIRAAQYSYYRSLSAWSPEISLSGTVQNADSRGYNLHHPPAGIFPKEERFSSSGTLKSTWLLFNGLARELEILTRKLEYDRSIAASEDVKRLLIRAVIYSWCDILLASEEIIISQADKAFQDAALIQAEHQFKAGHISYSAVLNFKILAAKAQSKISLSQYNRKVAANALASLLGCDGRKFPEDIKLQELPDIKTELHHPPDFYLELAILNRPDLKAEKIQLEKALRQKQMSYAEFMPELHLFADFSMASAAAKYGDYAVNSSYYNHPSFAYGVTGSWNIFRGFGSLNELRRRKALEQAAFWGLNKKYLDVTTEVRDALDYCRNTQIQIGIFRSMKDWVLEQRNLIYSEYLNGRETISRLNQAQSDLVEAQSSLALWQIQSHKAEAQLNAALGLDSFQRK